MKDFGKRLYVLRKSRKMSSEQVAEKVGTSRITIRSYEKEETFPNIEMLNRLADCYNVSSDFLLGRNPYPTAKLDIAKSSADGLVNNLKFVDVLFPIDCKNSYLIRLSKSGEIL